MNDQGISLNTILVHSVILKKNVCDLGEEFEYKILLFRLFTSMFHALSKSLQVRYQHSFIVERCRYFWNGVLFARLGRTFLKSSKESYRIWVL